MNRKIILVLMYISFFTLNSSASDSRYQQKLYFCGTYMQLGWGCPGESVLRRPIHRYELRSIDPQAPDCTLIVHTRNDLALLHKQEKLFLCENDTEVLPCKHGIYPQKLSEEEQPFQIILNWGGISKSFNVTSIQKCFTQNPTQTKYLLFKTHFQLLKDTPYNNEVCDCTLLNVQEYSFSDCCKITYKATNSEFTNTLIFHLDKNTWDTIKNTDAFVLQYEKIHLRVVENCYKKALELEVKENPAITALGVGDKAFSDNNGKNNLQLNRHHSHSDPENSRSLEEKDAATEQNSAKDKDLINPSISPSKNNYILWLMGGAAGVIGIGIIVYVMRYSDSMSRLFNWEK